MKPSEMPPDPRNPGKHINPETGIWPTSEWCGHCHMGFVSNSRFGGGLVIKRTNRKHSTTTSSTNSGTGA